MQPIYQSNGKVAAVVHRGHLYNLEGYPVGYLRGANLHDLAGEYLGALSEDRRLLRVRRSPGRESLPPPRRPSQVTGIPKQFPLAPMFAEPPYQTIDLFEEYADRLAYIPRKTADRS
jgi:hypothetical protein